MSLYLSFDYYRDQFTTWIMHVGMPLVHSYHVMTGSMIINTASSDAEGLEKVGDVLLAPAQYLMAGRYFKTDDGITYAVEQRFNYEDPFLWVKTGASCLAFPFSLVLGGGVKAISLLFEQTREHQEHLAYAYLQAPTKPLLDYYEDCGIHYVSSSEAQELSRPIYERRPGDEKTMEIDKKALKEIVALLNKDKIPYWLDCGTLLGAYRYAGIIPWDFDLDIAILQPDFENAFRCLSKLDSNLYTIQDWSSRDRPKSYLKVYVKETGTLIDIYHFQIDSEKKVIRSVLSNENCVFLPESWKIRERRFTIDTPIEDVFPLKKTLFDGIEVFVPCNIEAYLKQRYGENISPAKVYNSLTKHYEKDLSHPYWQMPHAH